MKQKLLSIFLLCTLLIGAAYAQNRQVSGKVTSATDGSPLSGVSVAVVGATAATQTDGSGNYSISVANNATLLFSYIGFGAQRIPVGTQVVINVALHDDATAIDEVVVTANAIKREKRSLGYSAPYPLPMGIFTEASTTIPLILNH